MANETSSPTTWSDLAVNLYDKLTGRHAEIIYEFKDLEIFIPMSATEDAVHAKWKVNGTVKIRTHDTSSK
jgi:hypothetical protein